MIQINTLLDLSRKMRLFSLDDKAKFLEKLDTCPKANFEKHRRLLEVAYNLEKFIKAKEKTKIKYIDNPRINNIPDILSIIRLLYSYTGLDSSIKKAFRESVYINPNWSIENMIKKANNQRT